MLAANVLIGIAVVGNASCLCAAPADAAAQPAAGRKTVLIEFGTAERTQDIQPQSEAYLLRQLDKARELQAEVVVIRIDSPGGHVESSVNLAEALRDLAWAETVAYIPRQALSGAAIMALGCDQILMHTNARIGDAGPIFMGEDFMFRHAPEKVRSDLVRKVRDLATATGRPPAIAEAMVDLDLEVFKVEESETGEVSYMSKAELRALDDPMQWKQGALLEPSKKGSFLEVNGRIATEVGLAQGVVNSTDELLTHLNTNAEQMTPLRATWVDRLVGILTFWPVTALLFAVGLVALNVELAAPGIGVGALLSGLCFALFFWSRFLGGTAGWLELVLFLAGIAFLLMELFVIPGFGIAGLAGLLLLAASLLMATQRFAGSDGIQLRALGVAFSWLIGAAGMSVIGMYILTQYFGGLRLFNHLTLEPPAVSVDGVGSLAASSSEPSIALQVGDEGLADSTLRPSGRAKFGEHYHDVITEGSFVDAGTPVRVMKISGTHVTVRAIG